MRGHPRIALVLKKSEKCKKGMNDMKQKELKLCPFCGGAAEMWQLPDTPEDIRSGMWVVGCDGPNGSLCPGYRYKLTPFYTAEELAIKMWNERK